MTDYTNAPATKMLASFCACCSRELLDANSVETGVGPECARRHGFGKAQGEPNFELAEHRLGEPLPAPGDAHRSANVLVHRIAVEQTGAVVARAVGAIDALGYHKLATRVAKRLHAVVVECEDGTLLIRAPKLADEVFGRYTEVMRRITRWDSTRKVRVAPAGAAPAVWSALKAALPAGTLVSGPRGISAV